MKQYITIRRELCDETLDYFIDEFNAAIEKEADEIHIFLKSEGGNSDIAFEIVQMINDHREKVYLHCRYMAESAAFYILFASSCRKYCYNTTVGMFHKSLMSGIHIDSSAKAYHKDERFDAKHLTEIDREMQYNLKEIIGIDFTKNKKYQKNKSIFFRPKEMIELAEKSNKFWGWEK